MPEAVDFILHSLAKGHEDSGRSVTRLPGRPSNEAQAGELEAGRLWVAEKYGLEGVYNRLYESLFAPARVDWERVNILDVGAGPVSIFEHVAPAGADIVAYDSLAEEYNKLVPYKKFHITSTIPPARYRLITILNCLDHMDDPREFLAHIAPHLHEDGEVWIFCNVDQPYLPDLHPQDFRFWQLVHLTGQFFDIARCGLVREGRLFPYAWWAVCRPRSASIGRRLMGMLVRGAFNLKCAAQYGWFHGVRAAIKSVKIVGLRRFLPRELQF